MKKLLSICAVMLLVAAGAQAQTPVNCGASITIKATPQSGYHFVNWNNDATLTANPYTITNVRSAATYTAYFEVNDTDFGEGVEISPANPEVGQTITLTPTPADCQEFVRWSDGNPDNPRTITYNGTVPFTAQYQTIVYNITVTSANASQGSVSVEP